MSRDVKEPVRASVRRINMAWFAGIQGRGAAVAAITLVLAVACGGDDGPDAGDGSPTGESSATAPSDPGTPTPSPTPTSPRDPSETPTDDEPTTPPLEEETVPPMDLLTLTGVPRAGVEMNCWLLDDYLLLGGDRESISSGQRLEITGRVMKGVATTCQQGTPFQVESVTLVP